MPLQSKTYEKKTSEKAVRYLLLDDLRDDARADGLAALADGKAQALLHGDGRDQRHHHLHVVPGHHHLGALGQLHRAGHVGGAEVKLRPVVVEERRVAPALLLAQDVHLALELRVRGDRAGLGQHLPRSTSSRFVPLRRMPTLSPACPSSSIFLNISTPVHTVLVVGRMPTISISSPTLTMPRSTRPVTTVPLPEMEKTSSTGIRNGLSISRLGVGMYASSASASFMIAFTPMSESSPSSALSAEPITIGVLSPGKSYLDSSSLTSTSTSSKSSLSSTMSALFRNTTM